MKIIFLLFVLCMHTVSFAQITSTASITVQQPIAIGEFSDVVDQDLKAGARLSYYIKPAVYSPFQLGVVAGFFSRGHATKTLPINIAGYNDNYEVGAYNSVFSIGLDVMWEFFPDSRFRPYVEGEVGGIDFYSIISYSPKGKDSNTTRLGKNKDTKDHWGFYYGGSVGMMIAIGKKQNAGIQIKCGLYKGAETTYNAKPEFLNDNTLHFRRLRSATDMIIPQIGAWLVLTYY